MRYCYGKEEEAVKREGEGKEISGWFILRGWKEISVVGGYPLTSITASSFVLESLEV